MWQRAHGVRGGVHLFHWIVDIGCRFYFFVSHWGARLGFRHSLFPLGVLYR